MKRNLPSPHSFLKSVLLLGAASLGSTLWGAPAARGATDIDISTYYTAGWADQNAPGLGNTELNNGPQIATAPQGGNTVTGITFGEWNGHYVEVGYDIGTLSETLSFTPVSLPTNPAVNALFNTFYGVSGQVNGTVVFTNDQGQTAMYTLVGSQTIRDYHNNVFTNDLQGYNVAASSSSVLTTNWWNNSSAADGNGRERLDVTTILLPANWAGTKLTSMELTASYSSNQTADLVLSALQVDTATNFSAFFNGEVALSNGVYYLAFPNGNYFGYYSFLSDPHYLYHFDMGYEYVFDAADGKAGVYLYDFKSQHFFYTSPGFPFPYLYDLSLNTVLYYYPDPNNPGRYNTNGTRYFYDFATGQIITE